MKAQSVTLAIAALVLWLVPTGGLAQGNSGKSRLTICHIPPGNRDARKTMTVPESAWSAHEAHGDLLGPCEEYSDRTGDDAKPAKKGKKAKQKDRNKSRSGSDVDAADEEIASDDRSDDGEMDDRSDAGESVDEADPGSADAEADAAARRARREQRSAERRAGREETVRDRNARAGDASQPEAGATSDGADAVKADDGGTATDDAQPAEPRGGRKARTADRDARDTQPDAKTEDPPEEERGFFRGMRQFFGFGGDEGEKPSGDVAE